MELEIFTNVDVVSARVVLGKSAEEIDDRFEQLSKGRLIKHTFVLYQHVPARLLKEILVPEQAVELLDLDVHDDDQHPKDLGFQILPCLFFLYKRSSASI